MDIENKHPEDYEQTNLLDEEVDSAAYTEQDQDDELKAAITDQMQKIYNNGMIVGFQTACHVALNKIYAFESARGKKSANDYKRILKDLKKFCETGVSRKVGDDETEQN